MSGKNVGDLLNAKNITWGFFEGGFRPTNQPSTTVKAVCGAAHKNIGGATVVDYIQHHEPFQYYMSTANPHHLPPTSVAMIGRTDQANHQYDLLDFWAAADSGHLPAVSYLKAGAYQDGHAGYSDPLDEQHFLVETINHLMRLPTWSSTAVIINWDDSDGWYDHVMAPGHEPIARFGERFPRRARELRPAEARCVQHPLRLRSAPAAVRRLDVGQVELCGPLADRPIVDSEVHRGQLGPRPDRRSIDG